MSPEKNFPATQRKLNKLIGRGEIYKSKQLSKSLTFYLSGVFFVFSLFQILRLIESYFEWLFKWLLYGDALKEGNYFSDFSSSGPAENYLNVISVFFEEIIWSLCKPLFFSFFIIIIIEFVSKRFVFSLKFPAFNILNLSPSSNIKKVIGLGENSARFKLSYNLLKNSLYLIFFMLGFLLLLAYLLKTLFLVDSTHLFNSALIRSRNIPEFFQNCLSFGSLALIFTFFLDFLLVLTDYFIEKKWWIARHSMDIQELKDEEKEDAGNPQVKSQRTQTQTELAYSQLAEKVKSSKVLIID